ncbi:M10 family metallopeptidase C-terminal domain-containing protein [Inquilinus limosus]|uniref:M10 family metallopeptidase C-terminal domain-containing protein n=1 Tax=Inquilinus limosus TaxID=171674 RepID=UPI003F17BD17
MRDHQLSVDLSALLYGGMDNRWAEGSGIAYAKTEPRPEDASAAAGGSSAPIDDNNPARCADFLYGAGEGTTDSHNSPCPPPGPDDDIRFGARTDDDLWGAAGDDRLAGDDGNDVLEGNSGNDRLDGDEGDDRLYGGDHYHHDYVHRDEPDNDWLDGGAGSDELDGGAGADTLTGGAGADLFYYEEVSDSAVENADRITDFSRAEGDRIDLGALDADTTRSGNQAFGFVGAGGFSGKAGELRYEHRDGNTVVQGDTNGDGQADLEIVLTGMVDLKAEDFVL